MRKIIKCGWAEPMGLLLRHGPTPTIYNGSSQAHIKARTDTHLCNTSIEPSLLLLDNAQFENKSRCPFGPKKIGN
ncbi:hypothetical protein TorRG33x02_285750 [Trema orientale]|uniref:Uncharacterized protein n=1 Tax=Trema orientale TaxID=63057 RepID=A0A2P5CGC1_TREOI|nr:hypothetical protein TorRG33x02_285750 [Trema orientale]